MENLIKVDYIIGNEVRLNHKEDLEKISKIINKPILETEKCFYILDNYFRYFYKIE
jgi:hypothetical protein